MNNYFVREAKNCKTDLEILNFYRNLYYEEEITTEQGLMARAINGLFMSLIEHGVNLEEINTKKHLSPFAFDYVE